MKPNPNIKLLYIDLFCGAGGTSTGVENARYKGMNCAKVIACVNHDKNAIASHTANHPDTLHFTEDIRTLDLSSLMEHLRKCRNHYPNAKIVLWASLECTNFSIAKGGCSRDADSRTLAEHLYRYVETINPDYIQIENVKEFMTWGPLIAKVVTDKKTDAQYCSLTTKTITVEEYEDAGMSYFRPRKRKKHTVKKKVLLPTWVPDPAKANTTMRGLTQ